MSDINVTVQDEIVEIDVIDTPVYVDVINSPGAAGPAGPGVAVGGTTGQILAKASATNYDTEWINNYAKYLATNVRNQTGSTIAAFRVVYISGATGNKPLVSLADADTEATSSKTYGVTSVSIANNGTGDVVTAGELSGIDTSAFNEGDSLWLSSTAGQVQTTPPAEPAHTVFIGTVVRSHPTLGVIDVAIANGYELTELHGVEITSAANNDGLFYNGSLWVNKSISTVLGYTPEQPLTFSSPLSRVGNVVSIPQATGSVNGFLSSTDWTTFNSKQAALGYTPANAATTLTINGVTYDLSANRSWTISTGISGSGTSGQVTYWTGASSVSGSNNLFWDNTNARLGIGTNAPAYILQVALPTGVNTLNNGIVLTRGAGTGIFVIGNGTSNVSTFVPSIYSRASIDAPGFYFGASVFNTSSTFAAMEFQASNATNNAAIGNSQVAVRFSNWNTGLIQVFGNGNTLIQNGGTFTDNGARLQVSGDTTMTGSGNTSATTALSVRNSSSQNIFRFRNDGVLQFGNSALPVWIFPYSSVYDTLDINGQNLSFYPLSGSISLGGGTQLQTSGASNNVITKGRFQPTSGTATFAEIRCEPLINQTGGANGITRGLYVNPTLTSAADFRAIEVSAGVTVLAPSVTARASLRIPSGTAPTSPANGDIWFDGTDIKMRIGGVTKTFTLV